MPAAARCFGRDAAVGGGGRMGDGGLGVAQVGGDRDHAGRIHHAPGGVLAALDLERDDAAAGFLLLHRQRMLRMRRQAGVIAPAPPAAALPASAPVPARCANAPPCAASAFPALEDHPGIEGGQRRPGGAQEGEHRLPSAPCCPAPRRPAPGPGRRDTWWRNGSRGRRPVPAAVAATGVQKQLSTASQAPACMGDVGQRGDVADFGQRIGRRFDEEQLGVRAAPPRARRRDRSAKRRWSRRRSA